jgi:hypothetical protein
MTQKQNRSLFREHALQHYMNMSENDLLPRIISPPIFLFIWILLGVIMISGFLAWMERVPVFVNSSGVAQVSGSKIDTYKSNIDVVVFVPTSISRQVHVGMHARVQFDASSQYFDGTIANINPLVLSPMAIRKQYQLTCNILQDVLVPSIAANLRVVIPSNMTISNGAPSQVQIQTGSQRVLDLLPLFHQLTGDS